MSWTDTLQQYGDEFLLDTEDIAWKKTVFPYSMVSLAAQASGGKDDPDGNLARAGQFYYRSKLYVPELDESSDAYDPQKVKFSMEPDTFLPTSEFRMLVFSVNYERIRFDAQNTKKVLCFSKDAKYPDMDNPFSNNCGTCPEAAKGGKCNLVPSLMGLDSKMRPVVVQLNYGSIQEYSKFVRACQETAKYWKARGEVWAPFMKPIAIKTEKVTSGGYTFYSALFPDEEELRGFVQKREGAKLAEWEKQMEAITNAMAPIRAVWNPKYMPPGTRKLGQYIGDTETSDGTPAGTVPTEGRILSRPSFAQQALVAPNVGDEIPPPDENPFSDMM